MAHFPIFLPAFGVMMGIVVGLLVTNGRFNVRTLLLAVAFLAIVLGIAAYLDRK